MCSWRFTQRKWRISGGFSPTCRAQALSTTFCSLVVILSCSNKYSVQDGTMTLIMDPGERGIWASLVFMDADVILHRSVSQTDVPFPGKPYCLVIV